MSAIAGEESDVVANGLPKAGRGVCAKTVEGGERIVGAPNGDLCDGELILLGRIGESAGALRLEEEIVSSKIVSAADGERTESSGNC